MNTLNSWFHIMYVNWFLQVLRILTKFAKISTDNTLLSKTNLGYLLFIKSKLSIKFCGVRDSKTSFKKCKSLWEKSFSPSVLKLVSSQWCLSIPLENILPFSASIKWSSLKRVRFSVSFSVYGRFVWSGRWWLHALEPQEGLVIKYIGM